MSFTRLNFILILFSLFCGLIFWRLFNLQIRQGDFYKALAQGLNMKNQAILEKRGEVFLKNDEPLVINKDFPLVFAVPAKVEDSEKTAKTLAEILQLPPDFLVERLSGDGLYSLLKSRINSQELELLKKAKLVGVFISQESGQYFPQETMASQAVGFVDANARGRYGLLEYYDEFLTSQDLNLTIDYDIQFLAEKLLVQAKDNLNIEAGQIIVLEPNSGRILAMANFPNFNPNQYREYAAQNNLGIFINPASQKIFEPGSVFKPITLAAALEESKITPKTTYVDEGIVRVGGYKVLNYDNRVYGLQTMTNVLEKSINTGAVFAEKQLGHNLFLKYLEKFGFFEKTGVDFAETYSENKELKKGYEINFATASFGQGLEITPLQLVRAFSVIANGGRLVKPYLAENQRQPELSEPVISQKTASQLTAMLMSVVENGFGRAARIPGYYIAGKTGTAQVPEKGKYSADKTVQSFIGFFPALNPKFLMLVKLDNPGTKTAEYSAVPIFREMADYMIKLYQIPPDYE